MTNTFTVINIFLYKITFSLGILTTVNRSPDIQTKAYHMVISNLYIYTWATGIHQECVSVADNSSYILILHLG